MRCRRALHIFPVFVTLAALVLPLAFGGESDAYAAVDHDSKDARVTARAASVGPPADQLFPMGSPAMTAAHATALAYWGANPCNGRVQMAWTVLAPGTNATASWRNPTDAWNNPAANFDCRIDINPRTDYDFAKLCTVLTHEIGHLLGHPHAPQPNQLMSAYYSSPLPQCMNADPAATPPPPPPTAQPASDDQPADRAEKDRAGKDRSDAGEERPRGERRRCVVRFRHGRRVMLCRTRSDKRCRTALRGDRRVRVCTTRATTRRCRIGRRNGERVRLCATKATVKRCRSTRRNGERAWVCSRDRFRDRSLTRLDDADRPKAHAAAID